MPQCDYQPFSCLKGNYDEFDSICRAELAKPISAEDIVNRSNFCVSIAIDLVEEHGADLFSVNDYLSGLRGKMGLYHLWIEMEHCQDHDKHLMLCAYVGKGYAWDRVRSHIKKWWPREEMIYISFYECENRVAKYLEQLFLDTYNFHMNKEENSGTEYLYARWDPERITLGTETHAMAEILSEKHPESWLSETNGN